MKVIIPAAGIGKRLRPHTLTVPKPLIKVGKKTIIDYVINSLKKIEYDEMIFITGYKEELLKQYLKKNYTFKKRFVFQETARGLAEAIYLGLEHIDDNEKVIVLLSDTIIECNLDLLSEQNINYIGTMKVNDPSRFGVVYEENGSIIEMIEKPQGLSEGNAIVGFYYFKNAGILKKAIKLLIDNNIKTKDEFQLTDAMKIMLKNGEPFKSIMIDKWIDCGNHKMLLKANHELLKRESNENYLLGKIIDSNVMENVSVFDNCEIIKSKLNNCIIDNNSIIENCKLNNSVIGKNCIIKNVNCSIIAGDYTVILKEDK